MAIPEPRPIAELLAKQAKPKNETSPLVQANNTNGTAQAVAAVAPAPVVAKPVVKAAPAPVAKPISIKAFEAPKAIPSLSQKLSKHKESVKVVAEKKHKHHHHHKH